VYETAWFRLAGGLVLAVTLGLGASWRARAAAARAPPPPPSSSGWSGVRTAELAREKEVTARQAASLAELDRAKDRFFANISHEFRTPLTLILGPLADLIEGRSGVLPAAVRVHHAMMQRNAQRLLRLINQVLDLTRLESGQLALDMVPGDLVATCRATTASFAPLAERRRIALVFEAPAAAVPVRLDAPQFEKVLLNLLSNAFKFTEPGGRVAVQVDADYAGARLVVRDTGVGIAPALLPRVFDRFFQADSTATRRHEGSGIGLSLARELVELHGGTVTADSTPGVGSAFTVRLPLLPAAMGAGAAGDGGAEALAGAASAMAGAMAGATAGAPRPAAEPPTGTDAAVAREEERDDRTTVLVVDDNADVRAYVAGVLAAGYRVLEAADGAAGLALAREALPDLVLADVMMPRLDGFALARALREDPATDGIPVVLLTARADAGDEVAGLSAGADDYVTKPFDRGVLEARIAALIATRRRLRERYRLEGLPAPAAADARVDSAELAASLVAAAPAADREPSELERRLRRLVEARLTEPELKPDALAAAAGLSYQQLYRRLRDELGVTPSQFIRTVRVERAAELLRAGEGSVTEVAYAVGFNALSHFHRSFRERFGVAPTALASAPR
jgi:signal transduction histidine kinase/DNA-binding response OmpR family regulator